MHIFTKNSVWSNMAFNVNFKVQLIEHLLNFEIHLVVSFKVTTLSTSYHNQIIGLSIYYIGISGCRFTLNSSTHK